MAQLRAIDLLRKVVLRNTRKMGEFSAAEASRFAGFEKPWMLNHLEREAIFVPDRSRARQHGKHRKYSFRDLIVLRAINRLLKLGARPKRIKESIDTFVRVCPDSMDEDLALQFARRSSFFVVTESKVLFCTDANELVDLASRGQLAFSFMLDNGQQIGPSIEAGLFYLNEVRNGKQRGAKLLNAAAKRFRL